MWHKDVAEDQQVMKQRLRATPSVPCLSLLAAFSLGRQNFGKAKSTGRDQRALRRRAESSQGAFQSPWGHKGKRHNFTVLYNFSVIFATSHQGNSLVGLEVKNIKNTVSNFSIFSSPQSRDTCHPYLLEWKNPIFCYISFFETKLYL